MFYFFRGEDERERLESARSIDEGCGLPPSRERSLSIANERIMRNRNLSSASQGSTNSPAAMRRSLGPASNISPASGPGVSPSSTVIAVVNAGNVAAGAASRESLSLDSGNQSPDTTSGQQRLSTSLTDSRSADADSLLADEEQILQHHHHQQQQRAMSEMTTSANTHIIRVSGPVTNLDETVLSANNILMSSSVSGASGAGAVASGGSVAKDKKSDARGSSSSSQNKSIPEVATQTSV